MSENKLPDTIETNEDVAAWEEHLNKIDKEELVGFILDKMIMDNKFFEQIRLRYSDGESFKEFNDIIDAFDNEINLSYKAKEVDTEFVVAITKHFKRLADGLKGGAKEKAYKHMAEVLDNGIEYHGLGYADDFEVTELIKELSI